MICGPEMHYGEYRESKENFLAFAKNVPIDYLLSDEDRIYKVFLSDGYRYEGRMLPLLICFKQYSLVRKLVDAGLYLSNKTEERIVRHIYLYEAPDEYDSFWEMARNKRFSDESLKKIFDSFAEKPDPFEYLYVDIKPVMRIYGSNPKDIKKILKSTNIKCVIHPEGKPFYQIVMYFAEELKGDNEGLSLLLDRVRACISDYPDRCYFHDSVYIMDDFWIELNRYYEDTVEKKKRFMSLALSQMITLRSLILAQSVLQIKDEDKECLEKLFPGERVVDDELMDMMISYGGFDCTHSRVLIDCMDRFEVREETACEMLKKSDYYFFRTVGMALEKGLVTEEAIKKWSKNCIDSGDYAFGAFLMKGMEGYRRLKI